MKTLTLILALFWTTHNVKYIAEAVLFINKLPTETRDSAYIVPLQPIDQDLDYQNFGRYAVVYKTEGAPVVETKN